MSGPGGFAALGSDPDEAERRIEQWAQGFAQKAQRYQAVREQTEQIRLTATGPDGRVKVTVRADGSVTDVQFTEKIRSMPLQELSAQIMDTMRKAQSDIAAKVGEVMTEQLGDEDQQTRSMMLDNLRERFPEEPDEPEAEQPDSGKWAPPEDDDPKPRPPAAPPAPPSANPSAAPKKPQRRRPVDDDDGDFGPDFDPLRD
ncbi:YbaB/EbfC family nucleoid-associated protein [Saccharopolyspora gloriosae]|uniref:YbaB/EbfC family nucleoid-associated protein n=1 Tax=Saccharopolyspora gloriosae TaxID=455344 RepID=UPI001FB62711|nr:YbaB/EbfC family nucleoid-associated protein [Saccharopolyspora gloriosae]